LKKAKTLDAALRAVVHVAYVWQQPPNDPNKVAEHLTTATRTPVPVLHERHLALPSAAFAGCFIGRGEAFVRRLLKRYFGGRLCVEEGAVRIITNTACVADDVSHHCQHRVTSQEATLGFMLAHILDV